MAKKSFRDNPALAFIGSAQINEPTIFPANSIEIPIEMPIENVSESLIKEEAVMDDTKKYYRLNLKLKSEFREYLEWASWHSKKSITQYINELVAADKKKKEMK